MRGRVEAAVRGCVLAALASAAILGSPPGLSGQEPPPPPGQQEPVDSTALRLRQRLQALGRPPGILPGDTIPDTLSTRGRSGARDQRSVGPAGDSVLTVLRGLEGYSVMSYEGSRADYDAESGELVLRAEGDQTVALRQPDGNTLGADSLIRYNQNSRTGEALGNPTATPVTGDPVQATRFVFDASGERASAFGARTRYSQGGGTNWNVTGDLPLVTQDRVYGDHTRFTSCDREDPHYHFETNQLKIVRGNVLVAKPVKLYFADVPVAWLPFVAQSLSEGRASGLLTPRFSVNDIVRTNGGYRRRISNVGFYWAMSDYTDATVAFDWFDDTYVALTGSLRYRWLRKFLDGSFNIRRYWSGEQGNQFALDTQNRWEIDERTKFDMSARYATSTSFVRRNSFDPREVTGQIRSQGGLSRRFDWGTLNVSADRSQSLSDDKVDMNLPRLGLSLRPITFFDAPPNRASWYNNLTWSGGFNMSRRVTDLPEPGEEDAFSLNNFDNASLDARATSGFNLGALSFSQGLQVQQSSVSGVPRDSLVFFPSIAAEQGLRAFQGMDGATALAAAQGLAVDDPVDIATTDLTWNLGLSYQVGLIGTSTITPNLSVTGNARRADTVDVAQDFVSGPTRVSFGANLKTDLYGFWPGFGSYSAIRHKLSPSFSYDWSPAVTPTELQERVFGSRALQPQSVLGVTLNQTWEAKREEEADSTAGEGGPGSPGGESAGDARPGGAASAAGPLDTEPVGVDDTPGAQAFGAGGDGEPRRLPRSEIVNLLSLRTSAVRYDFVEADSTGEFLRGFQTVTLQNQISSDLLRGLTVSTSHSLFRDDPVTGDGEGEGEGGSTREFAPQLTSMNFGFSLNPQSWIFRLIPFLGQGQDAREVTPDTLDQTADQPFAQRSGTDETSIIPGQGTDPDVRGGAGRPRGRSGDWQANFSYALNRPRDAEPGQTSQLLRIDLNLNPTPAWEASWTTSYDIESGQFADHSIRLTRDLHRWQANFDLLKTATGNWAFRFEVSLIDNQDLKFDYEQRNPDAGRLIRPPTN